MRGAQACLNWLSAVVCKPDQAQQLPVGLFRVPPADSSVKELRTLLDGGGDELAAIKEFVAACKPKRGFGECANAVATQLKWYLRQGAEPVLPWTFCNADLREFGAVALAATGDEQRGAIGAEMAQDLIHALVSAHSATMLDAALVELVAMVGQLLSLLCTVSRTPSIRMGSYELWVPVNASLSSSKDPRKLVEEAHLTKALNDARREAEAAGKPPPQTRLELLIEFGHRVWGYIAAALGDMEQIVAALRAADKKTPAIMPASAAEFLHLSARRKRDVLKEVFLHPARWFNKPELAAAEAAQTATAAETMPARRNSGPLAVPPPLVQPRRESVAAKEAPKPNANATANVYEPSKDNSAFLKDPTLKRVTPGHRVMSVRYGSAGPAPPDAPQVPTLDSLADSIQRPLSREEAAEVGRRLYRRATNGSAEPAP